MTKSISELKNDLKSKHWLVRSRAAEALGQLGSEAEEAVPALCESLQDAHKEVRRDTVIALQKIGPEAGKAVSALIRALDHEIALDIKLDIERALAAIGEEAAESLVTLLGHDQHWQRAELALEIIGEPAVPKLEFALGHKSEEIRCRAACVLWRIGPPAIDAIPKLKEVLLNNNEKRIVRFWALSAIGKIDPSAKPSVRI